MNIYYIYSNLKFIIIHITQYIKKLITIITKMLHELLFALIGKPGTIICSDSKGFMVDRSLAIFKDH
jgi:hypothetical protein